MKLAAEIFIAWFGFIALVLALACRASKHRRSSIKVDL